MKTKMLRRMLTAMVAVAMSFSMLFCGNESLGKEKAKEDKSMDFYSVDFFKN